MRSSKVENMHSLTYCKDAVNRWGKKVSRWAWREEWLED